MLLWSGDLGTGRRGGAALWFRWHGSRARALQVWGRRIAPQTATRRLGGMWTRSASISRIESISQFEASEVASPLLCLLCTKCSMRERVSGGARAASITARARRHPRAGSRPRARTGRRLPRSPARGSRRIPRSAAGGTAGPEAPARGMREAARREVRCLAQARPRQPTANRWK